MRPHVQIVRATVVMIVTRRAKAKHLNDFIDSFNVIDTCVKDVFDEVKVISFLRAHLANLTFEFITQIRICEAVQRDCSKVT